MTKRGEEILQELVEQIPEGGVCQFCQDIFPTVVQCWFLEAAKGVLAPDELLSDYARDRLTKCKNPRIMELVLRYRAES